MIKFINLDEIALSRETQPRIQLEKDVVSDYAEQMRSGNEFPPVVVFYDGNKYWLADGYHRFNASLQNEFVEIQADIREGTDRDAVLYACGANNEHGLRRTNADKSKAVKTLLHDKEWLKLSNYEIASICKVDEKTVRNLRKEVVPTTTENPLLDMERIYKKNGKTFKMKIKGVGNKTKEYKAKSADIVESDIPEDVNDIPLDTPQMPLVNSNDNSAIHCSDVASASTAKQELKVWFEKYQNLPDIKKILEEVLKVV